MDNTLQSYLIRLGFEINQPELNKFKSALKEAGTAAETHTSGIVQQFVKWQTAIVGAFAAVGLSTVAMMDKVADADLGFKLTAQRLFLSVDAARSLTIATKALGHSLEEIAWNPELHARLAVLWGDQRTLTANGPADAEQTLQKIRDVRFEITRAQVALQYIVRDVTVLLYKALGGDAFLVKLRGWVEWIIQHQAQISDWLTRVLVPILKDAEHVLHDVWLVAEKLAQAFVRIIGAISGDDSLRNGALTFDSLGKAIDKAADYMVKFVDAMTSAQLVVIDLVEALADLMHGFIDLANLRFDKAAGDFSRAGGDAKSAAHDLTGGGALILGGIAAFLGRGALRAGAGGVLEGAGAEAAAGGAGAAGMGIIAPLAAAAGGAYVMNKLGVANWIDNTLRKFGIDPTIGPNIFDGSGKVTDLSALASSVAWAESRGHQIDPMTGRVMRNNKSGALGIMQLMPGTAASLGVDPNDANQNFAGGMKYLGMLLKKYGGSVEEALAAYNWGPGALDSAMKRHGGQFSLDYLPGETQKYIRDIEGHMAGGVTINAPITVHGTNATPEQIRSATRDGISDAMQKSRRKDLVNSQGVYA